MARQSGILRVTAWAARRQQTDPWAAKFISLAMAARHRGHLSMIPAQVQKRFVPSSWKEWTSWQIRKLRRQVRHHRLSSWDKWAHRKVVSLILRRRSHAGKIMV